MTPFDVAKEEALSFIRRGEDKPGCVEKDVDSLIGEREKERKERGHVLFKGSSLG